MPTTSPDSIYYADGTTPASLADITAAMATSVQNAFNVREMQSFSWANSTAKSAQTGMIIGDIGYQIDNLVYYRWDGSFWNIWAKAPVAYTPTFTNLTPTSTSFVYSVASGVVTITGTCVNSTTTTTGIRMTLPTGFNINTTYVNVDTTNFITSLGTAVYYDLSATTGYPGNVSPYSASSVLFGRYIASTANLTIGAVGGATNPFGAAWASGDIVNVNFSYPVA
jgi:hypothetical protein